MPFASNVAFLAGPCREAAERGFARSTGLMVRIFRAYSEARRRRLDMDVLRQFDEHLLKDIGLNSHEIRRLQPTPEKYPSPSAGQALSDSSDARARAAPGSFGRPRSKPPCGYRRDAVDRLRAFCVAAIDASTMAGGHIDEAASVSAS